MLDKIQRPSSIGSIYTPHRFRSVEAFLFCLAITAARKDRKEITIMIVVLNPGASPERTQHLIHWLEEQNLGVHVSKGEYQIVLGLIGNTSKVDMEMRQSLDIVDSVTRVSDPF